MPTQDHDKPNEALEPQKTQKANKAENKSVSLNSWINSNLSEFFRVSLSNSTYVRRKLIRRAQLRRLQKLDRKSAKYLHFDPDLRTKRVPPMLKITPSGHVQYCPQTCKNASSSRRESDRKKKKRASIASNNRVSQGDEQPGITGQEPALEAKDDEDDEWVDVPADLPET